MCHEGPTLLLTATSEPFRLAYAFGIGSGNTGYEEKGREDAWESFLSRSSSSSSCLIRLVKVEGRYAIMGAEEDGSQPTHSASVGGGAVVQFPPSLLDLVVAAAASPREGKKGKKKRGG